MSQNSEQWLPFVLITLVLIRFLNALLLAALNGLGSIYIKAFSAKLKEQNVYLSQRLDKEREFRFQVEIFDKLSLLAIAILFLWADPLNWVRGLAFLGYLFLFDWAVPNFLALRRPEFFLERLVPVMRIFYTCFRPLAHMFAAMAREGEKYDSAQETTEEESPEEIDAFIQAGTEEGVIEEQERHLVENILNLDETVVREIMTPRTEMKCINVESTNEEALAVFKECGYSRLPVFRGNIDNIEGFIRLKDLALQAADLHFKKLVMPILLVPEGKNVADLLQEMLKKRIQFAIVLDEYGGTAGLTTLEDVLEEIVGEIHDEHELPQAESITALPDGRYKVDGRILLEDFSEFFNISLTHNHVDTVGGFLFMQEGRIPEEGFEMDLAGLPIEITRADKRRIFEFIVDPQKMPMGTSEDSH